ncbi:MAG: hypothetical protein R2881_03880 [Eubacteriales bacterium]
MKRFLSALLILAILITPVVVLAEFDYESIPTPNIIVVDGNDTNVVFAAMRRRSENLSCQHDEDHDRDPRCAGTRQS